MLVMLAAIMLKHHSTIKGRSGIRTGTKISAQLADKWRVKPTMKALFYSPAVLIIGCFLFPIPPFHPTGTH